VARSEPTPGPPGPDGVATVAGAVFTVLGVGFLLHSLVGFKLQGRWLWPILLILAGLAVLFSSRPSRP